MDELEEKIYDITSEVQNLLGDAEEFRIDLNIALKKMKEFNESLIDTDSDVATENANQNIFMLENILNLIKEQKNIEDSSPLNELVRDFENETALRNEVNRKNQNK